MLYVLIIKWHGGLLFIIMNCQLSIPHYNKKNCSGVYVGMRDNLKSEILRESI